MSLTGSYNNLTFKNYNELSRKFFDFNSLSSSFIDNSLSSLRNSANLNIDYSNFKEHIFFNSAEIKVTDAIKKILTTYPIGISGASTASLSAQNVAEVDNYILNLNGFERYVLNYLGGITGKNSNLTLTSSVTSNSGVSVPVVFIERNAQNAILGSQSALTANLYSLALAFDSGLNRIFLTSGTADHDVIFEDDNMLYSSKIVPESTNEYINRSSEIKNLLPEIFLSNDINNVFTRYIYTIGQVFDDIKVYIDQFSNINHISYSEHNSVPQGLYQQLLAKHFGFELVDTMMYKDISSYLRKDSSKNPLYTVTYKIWNRILNNLVYILKRKGSKESVYALIRSYGLPENFMNINDYNFYPEPTLQNKIEYKNVKALKFNQGGWIEFNNSLSGSFSATTDFSIEARVSTSALSNSHYILHFQASPSSSGYQLYFDQNIRSLRFNLFGELGSSYISISSAALNAALSSNNLDNISHVNILATRRNNSLKLSAGWIDETSGSAMLYVVSGSTANVSSGTISANAKFTIGASANGVSSWNGIISEVKFYNFSLSDVDFKEHIRNFESLSFMNTVSGSLSGVIGQWKLKEALTLTGTKNIIVNTLNTSITGAASGTLTSNNFYTQLENVRKETSFTNAGDFIDDNVDVYVSTNSKFKKSNIINISFNPVSIINSDIINLFGNIDISELISDPSNFYSVSANNMTHKGYKNLSVSAHTVFSRYNSKINFNNYIQSLENISPIINGIINDIQQLLPARSYVNNRGVVVEPHLLEKNRHIKEADTISEVTQFKPKIDFLEEIKFNNKTDTTETNNALITSAAILDGEKYSTTDYLSLTSEQLLYVSKNETYSNFKQINENTIVLPAEQKVNNPNDTKLVVSFNRNFMKNLSTVTDWTSSITGNMKLVRESTGKIIKSKEKTVRLNIPATQLTTGLNNFFNIEIDGVLLDNTVQQHDFILDTKNGLNFKITRINDFLDRDFGILYLRLTNILNGKSSDLPIILVTDENSFGGTISIESNNSSSNPNLAI